MSPEENTSCYYSDLPSPMAYLLAQESEPLPSLTPFEIDRVIEMAWEDRTPFDAIEQQFGLKESDVKSLMKNQLKFRSYILWRKRVEQCNTKHLKTRAKHIDRFKCTRQRNISQNKISKRKRS